LKQNNHLEICIDKDGVWYFHGDEMKRQDIVQYFYRYLKRDGDGNYLIEIGDDRCYVRVEDAPYVIKAASVSFSKNTGMPYIELSLNDGSREQVNLSTPFRIGPDNVLYCRVKRGEDEARFSRSAYYQFCEYVSYDSRKEKYLFIFNQHSYSLVLTESISSKTHRAGREFHQTDGNGGSDVR
jgi:hypothetical protein